MQEHLTAEQCWHAWSPPKRHPGWPRLHRNSLKLDPDGTSAWLRLVPPIADLWTRIDLADLPLAMRHTWRPTTRRFIYARAMKRPRRNGQIVQTLLHRILLDAPPDLEVDHISGDTLDNRRSNLRLVTKSQNQQNRRGARPDSSTGVRGVRHLKGRYSYWVAYLQVDGRQHRRVFPHTDDGLAAATDWVKAKRRELMPYSAADQI